MLLSETTYNHQANLAAYCRTGTLPTIPGIHQDNILHYRRLVYNIVNDMLENAYPLTKALVSAKEWKAVVNDFFSNHPCQTPQVWYMPKEFYEYIFNSGYPLLTRYVFLNDLLWFEWTELEMFMMEDIKASFSADGDILFSHLVLNPEHTLLSFQYPVHKKNASYITLTDRGNYYVAANRNADGAVVFTDLSPALTRIVEYLAEEPHSIKELFQKFEAEYKLSLGEAEQQSIIQFINTAYQQQLIIGFKN